MTIKKITASVSIAFLLSFSILLSFQFLSRSYVDVFYLQDQFYSQDLKSTRKIFIIGSSETAVLNNTHINEYFKTPKHDYDVYNLSIASDQPSARLQTIDKIIKMRPDVVVYGVGYRDFANQFTLIQQKDDNLDQLLPTPQNKFNSFIKQVNSELDLIKSPKFVTEKVLDAIINDVKKRNNQEQTQEYVTKIRTPFYKYSKEHEKINQEINTVETIGNLDLPDTNDEVIALKKIITKLHNNNIKIIFFTTPYSKVFFDNLNDHNKNTFEIILNNISDEYDIPIYHLHDKYVGLDIWNDYNHIAMNTTAIIFTEDIEKIISKEI